MSISRIYVASDHAGFECKSSLVERLRSQGHTVIDCGPVEFDADDDYPPYCLAAATKVTADPSSLGIVIGGSGNGEQMAANKVTGIRAALGWSVEVARLARSHNNANVLGIGARLHSEKTTFAIVDAFLQTDFSGEARHVRRLRQLAEYEHTGEVPAASTGALTAEAASWAPPGLTSDPA